MIDDPRRGRRLLGLGAAALALLAVGGGSVAFAGNHGTTPSSSDAAATAAPVAASTAPGAGQGDAFDAAVRALVEDGTINQQQADVLRRQIDAGSIDEQELVDNGTLSAAQMQAVQARLRAVKESLAAAATSQDPTPEKAQQAGSSATDSDEAKRVQKEALAASLEAAPGQAQPTSSSPTK
jgi:hypothetical protein